MLSKQEYGDYNTHLSFKYDNFWGCRLSIDRDIELELTMGSISLDLRLKRLCKKIANFHHISSCLELTKYVFLMYHLFIITRYIFD